MNSSPAEDNRDSRTESIGKKLPPILYKYCDLRGLDILANLRLKVTPFNEFNDPFELAPRMELANSTEVVRSLILKDVKSYCN